MHDHPYTSNKKKGYSHQDDTTYIHTAVKTDAHDVTQTYIDRTPERPAYTSARKSNQRFSEAQRNIDDVIEMVSEKKRLNQEALEEVKHTNQEIVSHFSVQAPQRQSFSSTRNNRTAEHLQRQDSQNYVATSQFEWRPAGASSEYDPRKSQKDSIISQENLELRARLNEEIKKNNELMRYINSLEAQNTSLRDSKSLGATQNVTNLVEENRYLKSQLAISQASGGVAYNIVDELERLKEENNYLRRDTVQLLRNSGAG